MSDLKTIIERAFDARDTISPSTASAEIKDAVNQAIDLLNSGQARVAEKIDGEWVVNQWLKKAVLLSFAIRDNEIIDGGQTNYFDKVPSKFASMTKRDFNKTVFA